MSAAAGRTLIGASGSTEGPVAETPHSRGWRLGSGDYWREPVVAASFFVMDEPLRALIVEVYRFLDRPGCNSRSRATAMARLRWAADQAAEKIPNPPPPPGDE